MILRTSREQLTPRNDGLTKLELVRYPHWSAGELARLKNAIRLLILIEQYHLCTVVISTKLIEFNWSTTAVVKSSHFCCAASKSNKCLGIIQKLYIIDIFFKG